MSSTWRPGCSTPRRKAGFWCRRRWPARFGGRISARRGGLSSSKVRPGRLRGPGCSARGGGVGGGGAVPRQIGGTYLSKAGGHIVVKGKAEPIAVYEVLGERERAEPMYRPPFVDREQDLEQLRDLLPRGRGRARVGGLSGGPGGGETRLV